MAATLRERMAAKRAEPDENAIPHHVVMEQKRQETIARLAEVERKRAEREAQEAAERERKRQAALEQIAEIDRRAEAEQTVREAAQRQEAAEARARVEERRAPPPKPVPVILRPMGAHLHPDVPDVGMRTESIDGVPTRTLWYPAVDLFAATVVVTATRPGTITIGNAADEAAAIRAYEIPVTLAMVHVAERWLRSMDWQEQE